MKIEWLSVEDHPLPNAEPYINGFCIPAISLLYGFGFIVKNIFNEWSYTTDHKYYVGTHSVTHYLSLPQPPKLNEKN